MTGAARRAYGVEVVRATAGDDLRWIEAKLAQPIARAAVRMTLYPSPAVVLGCGQRPGDGDRRRAAALGVDLLVRQSGGGAMLVGPWLLGATVALPTTHVEAALPVHRSYRWLGAVCVGWLRSMGVAAVSVAAPRHDDERAWACFLATSRFEVETAGRKLAGFAQVRQPRGVVLTAGLLLAAPPWPLLCTVLGRTRADAATLAARTIACEELLARPLDAESAARALGDRLGDALSLREASIAA